MVTSSSFSIFSRHKHAVHKVKAPFPWEIIPLLRNVPRAVEKP
jgi:hypothetical protein